MRSSSSCWRLHYLDGVADAEEEAALARRIHSDPQCRDWFVALCGQLGMLHEVFAARRGRGRTGWAGAASVPSEVLSGQWSVVSKSEIRNQKSEIPGPEPLIPPIVIDTSSPIPSSLFSIHSPLGGWLFSYGVATLITGMAILAPGRTRCRTTTNLPGPAVAENSRRLTAPGAALREPLAPAKEPELSAGSPAWPIADGPIREAAPTGRGRPLGPGSMPSASGLMEITYTTGAKVILQGPCIYEVDSPRGGFLSLGKLTARVEKGVRGQGSEVRNPNPKSHISTIPIYCPHSHRHRDRPGHRVRRGSQQGRNHHLARLPRLGEGAIAGRRRRPARGRAAGERVGAGGEGGRAGGPRLVRDDAAAIPPQLSRGGWSSRPSCSICWTSWPAATARAITASAASTRPPA